VVRIRGELNSPSISLSLGVIEKGEELLVHYWTLLALGEIFEMRRDINHRLELPWASAKCAKYNTVNHDCSI
jgi:hypothetical protein